MASEWYDVPDGTLMELCANGGRLIGPAWRPETDRPLIYRAITDAAGRAWFQRVDARFTTPVECLLDEIEWTWTEDRKVQ